MFLFIVIPVYSTFISSSSVESCLNTGDSSLQCTKKLSISMAIENLQANGTETLEATLKSVLINNTQTNLIRPIKITVQKSQVKARYPLNYLQDFNNKANELLVAKSVFDCKDGAESDNPTCGWKYDEFKNRIWDSQGYCCKCNFEDFIGVNDGSYERGYSCKAFNLGSGSATAFCLVWDDLWYSSYEIMQYSIHYQIIISITLPDSSGNYKTKQYLLSPSIPMINTEDVIAKLVGDFAPASPPPNFESKVLFTPSKPASHLRVLVGSPYWMAIDRNLVSFNGAECNKVGTSYTGFRGQANKCEMPVNSCFSNQLDDLHMEYVKREAQNQKPLHFISRFGKFALVKDVNTRFLEYELLGSYSSLITLSLNADDLRFITTVSKGAIDFAEINNFEASTLDGTLLCQVSNIGNIVADFNLAFNCTEGVNPINAVPLSLNVLQTKQITTKVSVQYEKGKEYSCSLALINSIGEICDTEIVKFNTTDRHTDQGTQGGGGNRPKGQTGIKKDDSNLSCDDYCPSWYDIPCFVVKSCWKKFFGFIGIIISIIVIVIISKVIMRKYGICCYKCCKLPSIQEKVHQNVLEISNEEPSTCEESGQSCFFNSPTGFDSLHIHKPCSLKGKLVTTRSGSYFISTFGKRFFLNNRQIIRYISSLAEYSEPSLS